MPELFALLGDRASASRWASASTQPTASRRPGRRARSARRRRTGSTSRTSAPRATSHSPARTLLRHAPRVAGTATYAASSCSPRRAGPASPPRSHASPDGTLEIDGEAREGADARRRTSPARRSTSTATSSPAHATGLVAYRIPAGAHVRSLAAGLAPGRLDRVAASATARWPIASRPLRAERCTSRPGRRRARSPSASAPFVIRAGTPRRIVDPDERRTARAVRRRAGAHRSAAVCSE